MLQKMSNLCGFFLLVSIIGSSSLIAMHEAVSQRNDDLVEELITQGVDVNSPDEEGETPLFKAARNGDKYFVRLLLRNGANPLHINNRGEKARDVIPRGMYMIAYEEIEKAEHEWLNKPSKKQPVIFRLPLPVVQRFSPVASEFTQSYANATIFEDRFKEALKSNKSADVLFDEFELERREYVHQKREAYNFFAPSVDVSQTVVKPSDTWIPHPKQKAVEELSGLRQDAASGNIIGLERKLTRAKKEGTYSHQVLIALNFAVSYGQLNVLKSIMKHDNNSYFINQVEGGLAPLHRAAIYGHSDVANYLLDQGAQVDIIDADGITPLMSAASNGQLDIVTLLLQRGANPNTQAKKEFSLEYEGQRNPEGPYKEGFDIKKVRKGAVKDLGGKGRTALHRVVRMTWGSAVKSAGSYMPESHAVKIVNALMNFGANIYIKDFPWNLTVIDWTLANGQKKLFKAFVEGERKRPANSVDKGKRRL